MVLMEVWYQDFDMGLGESQGRKIKSALFGMLGFLEEKL